MAYCGLTMIIPTSFYLQQWNTNDYEIQQYLPQYFTCIMPLELLHYAADTRIALVSHMSKLRTEIRWFPRSRKWQSNGWNLGVKFHGQFSQQFSTLPLATQGALLGTEPRTAWLWHSEHLPTKEWDVLPDPNVPRREEYTSSHSCAPDHTFSTHMPWWLHQVSWLLTQDLSLNPDPSFHPFFINSKNSEVIIKHCFLGLANWGHCLSQQLLPLLPLV